MDIARSLQGLTWRPQSISSTAHPTELQHWSKGHRHLVTFTKEIGPSVWYLLCEPVLLPLRKAFGTFVLVTNIWPEGFVKSERRVKAHVQGTPM